MKKRNTPLLRYAGAAAALFIVLSSAFSAAAGRLPEMLVPVGRTAGIKLFAPGVIVVETSGVETRSGRAEPAADAGIIPGDIILAVEGNAVDENAELISALDGRAGIKTRLRILRDEDEKNVFVIPVENLRGQVCIGASVRDSIAGIGTITYYDPQTETFGALGHGICQSENGGIFPLGSGCLVSSAVVGINKGQAGKPGELLGVFDSDGDCGNILVNSERGLFGELEEDELYPENFGEEAIPTGDAKKGSAVIMSNISGENVSSFQIEIIKLSEGNRTTRNFRFRVTDAALIGATGGIVQGMSGSPVIQDGKLVGAVTHVCVNDPTVGYGIFIENMLDAAA
ncbi:MAG: PDZ domain-containing protein [Clostridia bacterium]|nr:PDZ domain-containing protein [Clostridia bacterium]